MHRENGQLHFTEEEEKLMHRRLPNPYPEASAVDAAAVIAAIADDYRNAADCASAEFPLGAELQQARFERTQLHMAALGLYRQVRAVALEIGGNLVPEIEQFLSNPEA